MSDEDTLRRAAAKVREISAGAVAGPWMARHTTNDGWPIDEEPRDADTEGADEFGELSLVAETALPRTDRGQEGRDPASYTSHHILAEHDEADLMPREAQEVLDSYRWAALMSPLMAGPLAVVLDGAADDATQVGADWQVVQLARALLGEQVPA